MTSEETKEIAIGSLSDRTNTVQSNDTEMSHNRVNSEEKADSFVPNNESNLLTNQSSEDQTRNKLLSLSNTLHSLPSMNRLKSTLQTPKNMKSTKNGYNALNTTHQERTGRTILNDNFNSSADIMLYDNDIATDDNTITKSTENTLSKSNDAFNFNMLPSKTNRQKSPDIQHIPIPATYNPSDTINSSIGYQTDDDFYDDIDDDRIRTTTFNNEKENKIKCNCFKWFKHYKKSLISTCILIVIIITFQLFVNRDNMGTAWVYLEFIITVVTIWNLVRLFWGVISYLLFICTARHWCNHSFFKLNKFLFYIHHSGTYITYSLLSTILYVIFIFIQNNADAWAQYSAVIEHSDPARIEFIERVFLCSMVLWYGLLMKTFTVRWICLTYYLSSHLIKIKKFRKYESWLKILLKTRRIYSIKVKTFLDINDLHNRNSSGNFEHIDKTIAFSLKVLAEADPSDLRELMSDTTNRHELGNTKLTMINNMNKINEAYEEFNTHDDSDANDNESILTDTINNKLVNTLTSGSMFNLMASHKKYSHNSDTCLLWLYNASTQKVSIIDDNDLDKICKKFAKYIVSKITKKRFDAKTPHGNSDRPRPSFTAIQSMFHRMSKSQSDPTGMPTTGGEIVNSNISKPASLKRSNMTVSQANRFIQQAEFIRRFAQVNQTRKGHEAWKDINMSDKILTEKELQRWLYQYFHDLIYLKQKLNSYTEILNNLDMSTNIIAIFVLFFVFLLIFEFGFVDSVSIYFSMIAIFAVFGKNVFTQFFDAIYFIFVLSPFEIGDVVLIDNIRYTVVKVHIMSTEMISAVPNGNTVVIKNNAKLLEKDIQNLSRTTSPYHNITFYISQLTSVNELNMLKLKIDTFIKTKMKNDISEVWFILDGVDKECRMKISLFLGSIYPFTKAKLMWKQYHLINLEIKKIVSQMGIEYKRFSAQDVQLSALIEDNQLKHKQH